MTRAALGVVIALAGTARADDVTIDWARGVISAPGIGIADRHAPSPAAARGPARRAAEDAARKKLATALPGLPLAAGGTLKSKLTDAATRARFERALADAIAVEADPETDGSWRVVMGVPLEAVRQIVTGPRAIEADDAAGPAVVIVEGAAAKPAIGWAIGALAAPTLWVKDVPAWAKDAKRVKARSSHKGTIELTDPVGTAATLFVVLAK